MSQEMTKKKIVRITVNSTKEEKKLESTGDERLEGVAVEEMALRRRRRGS